MAFPILQKLESIGEAQQSDSLKMIAKDRFAFYYFVQGDYEQSIFNAIEASKLASNIGDQKKYLDYRNNVGMILSKLNEFEKTKNLFVESLKNTSVEDNPKGFLATLSNLGSSLQSLNQIDSSNVVLNEALKLSRTLNYKRGEASILKFLSKNALALEDYNKVISLVNTIESNFWEHLQLTQKDDAIFYRAQAYFNINNFSLARKDIDKTLSLMNVLKKDPAYLEVISFKSKILEAQGKYKQALSLQNEVQVLRDSFDSASRTKKVLELEKQYETEKKEKENAQLKAETIKKDLIITEKNNQLLLFFLAFIFLVGSIISWQLKKFKIKNKQLRDLITQKTKLQQELDIVRDNIAKDFHDDLGNKLARITTLSDHMLRRENIKTKTDILDALNIIKKDADELYSGTRDFMFSLKTDSDSAEDIYAYLADFAQDYLSSLDVELDLHSNITSSKKVPYYWNRQIILIFKEAITNAIKHGEATQLKLSFEYSDDKIHVECQDNGSGFDVEGLNSKNGLKNMKQRASKINCNLAITSSESGTNISLSGKVPNFEYLKIA
ncbi:hypothetical protein Q2T40_09235 [Winogradskyella maritima]|uniref:histidine kinase n=1 Tax=Winogradskyella maritima TaxID=1517766 RepID=A0ABV8ALY3_9FLAO|nr:hypothetical protein [Winogradskyella maritima]